MKPVEGKCYVTQEYGLTPFARTAQGREFYKNFGGIHPGVDWGTGGVNAPAIALVSGEVVRSELDEKIVTLKDGRKVKVGWGNHVEIKSTADGWNRQYAHLQSRSVAVGDKVAVGQVIGRVGTTGSSTAIHLHYGKRRRKLMGGWEYADPSADFSDVAVAVLPTKKLIKGRMEPAVYVFNGRTKFHVPDWETLTFLFGTGSDTIEEAEGDIISKIPTGNPLPSLK